MLIILSLALLFADQRLSALKNVRYVLMTIVAPMQYVVELPVQLATSIHANFTSQQTLIKENARLIAEQVLIKAQLQQLISLEKENAHLLHLLDSSDSIALARMLVARILAISGDPFVHQMIVNQGSLQDVFLGQPVLNADGIVGQVVQVGALTSRIMLLTDPLSAIPVEDTRSGVRSILQGIGKSNELQLLYISKTADIKVGDELISSGLGLRYPAGYPVGTIIQIKRDPQQEFTVVRVQPSADLNHSNLVLLVWPSEKNQKINLAAKQQLQQLQQRVE